MPYGLGIVFIFVFLRGQENSPYPPQGLQKSQVKAIIIMYHCVVGGQRRKRELGRSCQGGLDGGHGSKVDFGGRKGLEKAAKSSLPGDLREGFASCGGGGESKEIGPKL